MVKRQSEPNLLLLAVLGILLYMTVTFASSYLQDPITADTAEPQHPAITKQDAADAAVQFVRERFALSSGYHTGALYQSHTTRSGYLQKERLYEDYSQRFESFPLDYYEVEINDAGNQFTYYVDVNYFNQRIVGWEAYAAPAARRQTVSAGAASEPVKLAEQAIADQGYTLSDFVRVDEDPTLRLSASDKAARPATGTKYWYQSKTRQIGDAKLYLTLAISGGKVVSFHPEFNIPASFVAWQQQQNDRASLMTTISMGGALVMTLVSIYILIRYRKEITFRRGLLLSFMFLAIYIGNNFNMLPAFRTSHPEGPSQFEAVFYLWFVNAFIVLMAASVYFALLAGKNMWLRRGWNPITEWSEPEFGSRVLTAMGRGYLLCLFVLGVQQGLFFIAGEYFDVWSVNDPSDSVLNMLIPGVFPLMAWAAAISEEAVYRLFGIAFFLQLVRSRLLAVLLPSMIWALSHTQYPIYPVYTRFVEVTLIGLIFGFFFLKYGFMTVLFAHASMDSILMGLSLIDMGDLTHNVIGALYLIVPALVGWILAWLHRIRKRRDVMPVSS
jgi:hypothetical protein